MDFPRGYAGVRLLCNRSKRVDQRLGGRGWPSYLRGWIYCYIQQTAPRCRAVPSIAQFRVANTVGVCMEGEGCSVTAASGDKAQGISRGPGPGHWQELE